MPVAVDLSLYSLPTFATALCTAGSAYKLSENNIDKESIEPSDLPNYAQLLVLTMITLWALGATIVLSTDTLRLKLFGTYLTLLGTVWTSAGWFLFGISYSGRVGGVERETLLALSVVPVILTVGTATNGVHELIIRDPLLIKRGENIVLEYNKEIGIWVGAAHNWPLASVTIILLIDKFLRSRNVYRKIALVNIIGGFTLLSGPILSTFELSPTPGYTLGILLFFFVSGIVLLSIISYRYLHALPLDAALSLFGPQWDNLTPIGRDQIVEEMESGVVVLDGNNVVVDCNPMARRLLAASDDRIVGRDLETVIDPEIFEDREKASLVEAGEEGQHRGVWVRTEEGDRRSFDILITRIERDEGSIGRAALINDVTDRERRKEKLEDKNRELEVKNEKLEEFGSILSHDLRNPLMVAQGNLKLARETGSEEAFEEVQSSLSRIETITDDVLELARQGQSIGETESVDLEEAIHKAWDHVATAGATIEVVDHTEREDQRPEIEADPTRLLQLFENCFRNAVEHGGEEVEVQVGIHDEQFYIADDGPGIPADERDRVLDFGYSSAESGTGFGLAIVNEIATAHGWELEILDASLGGVRLQFVHRR